MTVGKHVNLTDKEARRRLVALTKCASDDDNRPVLHNVYFDGTLAYATNSYVLGVLPFTVDVPDGGVLIPAKRLRDAVRLPGAKEPCSLRFGDDELVITIGEDTLPLEGIPEPTTITVAYMEDEWPSAGTSDLLNGERDEALAVSTVTVNSDYLARLGALADRQEGYADGVMVRPRGERKAIDVFSVDGERLGIVMPIRAEQPA